MEIRLALGLCSMHKHHMGSGSPLLRRNNRVPQRLPRRAEGVRNFRARNILCAMRPGQQCFFYHSNCKTPGIVGVMEVAKAAYADHTQLDKSSKYYDSKSTQEKPRWFMPDVRLVRGSAALQPQQPSTAVPPL
jgi:predicted RNA-binding protein with PUA-like domain